MGKRKFKDTKSSKSYGVGGGETGYREVLKVWSTELWKTETLSGDLEEVKIILIMVLRHHLPFMLC